MIVPDANLLLYAYNSDSPFHDRARTWWEDCLSGREPVGLTDPVVYAFVRIATNRRVFARPLSLQVAAIHVRSWLSRRAVRTLVPGATHIERVLGLLEAAGGVGGNLVTDAQIGALALEYRGVVHTADHDFRRFAELRVEFPLAPRPDAST